MYEIKYPINSYDRLLFIAIFVVIILYFTYSYYYGREVSSVIGAVIAGSLFGFVSHYHQSITPLLSMSNNTLHLDQGVFKRKLVIEFKDIEMVKDYNLNNEMIRLIFKLKSGKEIYYRPPQACNNVLLTKILLTIQKRLVSYKT